MPDGARDGGKECAPSSPSLPREPVWAIIFKPWAETPIYHRNVRTSTVIGKTACGRKVHPLTPWLPMKHVKKFARPCRGCFPS